MAAFPARSLSTHMRQPSLSATSGSSGVGGSSNAGQSPAMITRVEEKKAELANLQELRDLSAAVAGQMEALEQKLATLSDGTEAIALVLGNWHNVLRAINMASAKIPKPVISPEGAHEGAHGGAIALPQTLVRIPTEHAPALQAQTESAAEDAQLEE